MSEALTPRAALQRILEIIAYPMNELREAPIRVLAEKALRMPDSDEIATRLELARRSGQRMMRARALGACTAVMNHYHRPLSLHTVAEECVDAVRALDPDLVEPGVDDDPVNALGPAQLRNIVSHLRALLWLDIEPGGEFWNAEKTWDSETLDYIARVLSDAGLRPSVTL